MCHPGEPSSYTLWFTGEQRVSEHTLTPAEGSSSGLEAAPIESSQAYSASALAHSFLLQGQPQCPLYDRHVEDMWSRHNNPYTRVLSCRDQSLIYLLKAFPGS